MKARRKKGKLKMPKIEKGNIENFLKIKHAIHLGWMDYLTFTFWMIVGAVILPLSCKLSVEVLLTFFADILESEAPNVLPIFRLVQKIFEALQWFIYAALVSLYWFRCNIRLYNFHFTNDVVRKIRSQFPLRGTLRCPRCGYTMTIHNFSEKGKEYTGDRTEYDLKQYRVGNSYRVRTVKKVVPEYRDTVYERQYAMCQSYYCLFEEKKPYGKDSANYKFFKMPYRISDTLHYAVWTKNDTVQFTGNLRRYRHGLSVFSYLLITALILFICACSKHINIYLLLRLIAVKNDMTSYSVHMGFILGIGALSQIVAHVICARSK